MREGGKDRIAGRRNGSHSGQIQGEVEEGRGCLEKGVGRGVRRTEGRDGREKHRHKETLNDMECDTLKAQEMWNKLTKTALQRKARTQHEDVSSRNVLHHTLFTMGGESRISPAGNQISQQHITRSRQSEVHSVHLQGGLALPGWQHSAVQGMLQPTNTYLQSHLQEPRMVPGTIVQHPTRQTLSTVGYHLLLATSGSRGVMDDWRSVRLVAKSVGEVPYTLLERQCPKPVS